MTSAIRAGNAVRKALALLAMGVWLAQLHTTADGAMWAAVADPAAQQALCASVPPCTSLEVTTEWNAQAHAYVPRLVYTVVGKPRVERSAFEARLKEAFVRRSAWAFIWPQSHDAIVIADGAAKVKP